MRAFLAIASMLVSATAAAGVVLEMTDRTLADPQAKPGMQKLWFESGKFRADTIENGRLEESVIFRNGTLYAIEHAEKVYTVMDKAAVDRAANQLAGMRKQMEAQMAGMSPEERAMVEKMLQGTPGAKPATQASTRKLRNTARTDTVAGRKCRVWEVSTGNTKEQELCVIEPGSLPGGNELLKAMRDMTAMSRGFFEQLGAGEDVVDDAWAEIDKVGGIPILVREFEDGRAVEESRLTAVREEALGAAVFEVPKGFRQEQLNLSGDTQ